MKKKSQVNIVEQIMTNTNVEAKIFENWETFLSLIDKISDKETKEALTNLCNDLHEKIMLCPASTKVGYIGPFVGGLVWNSLNVLKLMKDMNKVYGSQCTADEMIITSLFYDLGKIGNGKEDYYLAQKSDWHKDRGMYFDVNTKLVNSPIVSRTIWWLNKYKVPMSENVVEALFSLYSSTINNKSSEVYNVSPLALLLQQSVRSACILNKNVESVLG